METLINNNNDNDNDNGNGNSNDNDNDNDNNNNKVGSSPTNMLTTNTNIQQNYNQIFICFSIT